MPMEVINTLASAATGDKQIRSEPPDRQKLNQRMKALMNERLRWEDRWKEIRNFELPFIGHFDDTEDRTNPARRRDTNIAHGTAWMCDQVFAAGVLSGLTPPSRKWFKFTFSNSQLNDNTDALKILDIRQEIVESVLAKSNFYNSVHSVYMELPFGQCPLGVFMDREKGVRFVPMTIGTYYLGTDGNGLVNTIARRFRLTLPQLIDYFGEDALPENLKAMVDRGETRYEKKFLVNWLCEPNNDSLPGKLDRLNMPFKSVYWLEGSNEKEYLYVGGFESFPCPVARYNVTSNQPYATGPGWWAEGDSKALQVLKKDYLTAIELSVKPPMQGSAELAMTGVNMIPGGFTPTNMNSAVQPLFNVQTNLSYLSDEIQRTEDRIKEAYSANLFMMLDNLGTHNMTAQEVQARQSEKLSQLGPVVERLQEEFLNLIIDRVYNILDRAHVFPPIPDEMQELFDAEVKVEYISPLAQAQKMSGVVNIEQTIGFVMQMAQAWPEALKSVNAIKTVSKYMDYLGTPAEMRKDPEEIDQEIQAEQEAQAQAQQEQQAMMVAQAAPNITQAAKNATEAANDGNPALQEWMGMGY